MYPPMARILFIQPQQVAFPGLYYICGALREAGHTYSVAAPSDPKEAVRAVAETDPQIVGFPCMTGFHKQILETASEIKRAFPACPIVLGGVHPTLFPDILQHAAVDFICRGEGEYPTCELLDAIDSGQDTFDIPNISRKKDGAICENEMRDLISPLDSLPFPDHSIYRDLPVVAGDTYPTVVMTRGCPFSCTYCHNSNQRKLYRGKGDYVRSFSNERILDEVESVIRHYPEARAVFLCADTLGRDLDWLSGLLTSYRQRFTIPYTCLVRPEYITRELAELLADTKCHMIAFGIESGSERIRTELLHRHYTNEDIRTAAAILKEHGLRFRTYNIVGFPTETAQEMMSTVELNAEIRPDFPWCSVYTPYPETELAEHCISNGHLPSDFSYDNVPTSFFNDTLLQNVDRKLILNTHSLFQAMVLAPWLRPLLRPLLRLPHNALYRLVFKAVYSWICVRSENRSFHSFLRLALANRKLFR